MEASYIKEQQNKDKNTQELPKEIYIYHTKTFHGVREYYKIVCRKNRIIIPHDLQSKIIERYHLTLLHLGMERTHKTTSQHIYWKGIKNQIEQHIKKYPVYQMNNKIRRNIVSC